VKVAQRGYWVSAGYKWMSVVYWSLYSIYFRTLTYFSVANPQIYLGGMLDERKTDIYKLVPARYLPKMKMYDNHFAGLVGDVQKNFTFPIIVKPNVGFRGFLVKRIDSVDELQVVAEEYEDKELLVQEFVKEAHEYSVMYYYVDDSDYGVSSLVEKHLPTVKGDGTRTLRALIEDSNNPFLKKDWILKKNKKALDNVIPQDEAYVIDHVGKRIKI